MSERRDTVSVPPSAGDSGEVKDVYIRRDPDGDGAQFLVVLADGSHLVKTVPRDQRLYWLKQVVAIFYEGEEA